jgi:hypothetical protein
LGLGLGPDISRVLVQSLPGIGSATPKFPRHSNDPIEMGLRTEFQFPQMQELFS